MSDTENGCASCKFLWICSLAVFTYSCHLIKAQVSRECKHTQYAYGTGNVGNIVELARLLLETKTYYFLKTEISVCGVKWLAEDERGGRVVAWMASSIFVVSGSDSFWDRNFAKIYKLIIYSCSYLICHSHPLPTIVEHKTEYHSQIKWMKTYS